MAPNQESQTRSVELERYWWTEEGIPHSFGGLIPAMLDVHGVFKLCKCTASVQALARDYIHKPSLCV